jgi:hypothetical protein
MKQLKEFDTLEEARAYTYKQGRMLHRDTMNLILAKEKVYSRLVDISENPSHPLRDLIRAFLASTEYNLQEDSSTGQAVISLMQALIAYEGDDVALQNVLTAATLSANPLVSPYKNTTDYEFAVAKGQDIPRKQVDAVKGYVDITTTADCPLHSPHVYVKVADKYRRITSIQGVGEAGEYSCQVPRTSSVYFVDDFYGVIE